MRIGELDRRCMHKTTKFVLSFSLRTRNMRVHAIASSILSCKEYEGQAGLPFILSHGVGSKKKAFSLRLPGLKS